MPIMESQGLTLANTKIAKITTLKSGTKVLLMEESLGSIPEKMTESALASTFSPCFFLDVAL
eukprot:m.1491 g.1491  ORF g.1491 m.1491 type:complete len:62 (+) comp6881_c0_seq1:379-564(+)